ncbi:glycoside hydrolase family 32 protein [Streptococcus panodentis]|uniref:Sucrose-6-phosphate hydrolase n=1 Tax=Streptococcus panodentis TaxID=1581472 RepID=A0ABS5AXP3_9STRE|nr:glycoside hydrolase family 32 protein [Streptococcus panodentis]MBP2621300.1 sucrose-6-phosphate hydrolase [Streptococcus panodentis]
MKEKITEANRFIEAHRHKVKEQYRGQFHLLPPIGWMNDPNGFVYFRGEYHLFYQFYPYDSVWGPMHWGHAKSRDLLHWEELPVALAPSEDYDRDGCFSGSALVVDDQLVLMYTGHAEDAEKRTETQCIAVSKDGLTFEKYAGNPVIAQEEIAGIADIADFRDPKIFKQQDSYYAVVASKTEDKRGQILLFESKDCLHWSFKSVLLEGRAGQGIMWECPDLFQLDGKWVLLLSPIEMERQEEQFWNLNSTLAFIGQVDWQSGRFMVENSHEIDGGLDFYAPQTCVNDQGERYLVAWMQMWHRTIPPHQLGHGWSGMMTLPRKLSVRDGRLHQEIPESFFAFLDLQEEYVHNAGQADLHFANLIQQQQYIRLSLETASDVELAYARNPQTGAAISLSYSHSQHILQLSREGAGHKISGQEQPYLDTRLMKLENQDQPFVLELVRDTSSIEVFLNGQTMSMTFYEKDAGSDLFLRTAGLGAGSLELYAIRS